MKDKSNLRVCKKCQKPLPEGYKHKYCEACRNQYAQTTKNALKWFGACAATTVSAIMVVITKWKIDPKE